MAITEELRVAINVQAARAVANLERYQKAAKNSTTQTSNFASVAKKAAGLIGGAVIAGAIGKAAASSIKFAAAIEKQKASFETLLGTTARANKFFNQIRDFSAATPFALPDLTKGAQRLLAFGTEADDVVEKLEQLGNAAQGDSATLERLVDAFGKVQARGRASLEDLNRFTEAGVPIMEELGRQTGKTGVELFKMVTEGRIGFEQLDKAIVGLTTGQGDFAGLLEKQSQTLSGLFSTAKDNLNLLGAEIGDLLLPALKQVLTAFTRITQSITQFVRNNRGKIQGLFENFPEIARLVFRRVLEIARDAIRFENLRDVIVAIGAGIIRILGRTWDELLTIFVERLKILAEPFRAIGVFVFRTFQAIVDRIGNLAVDAVNLVISTINDSRIGKLISDKLGVGFQELERSAETSFPSISEAFDESVDNVLTSAGKIAAAIVEIGKVGIDELGNVGRDIGEIFDDEKAAAFREELQKLLTTVQALEGAGGGGGATPDTGGGGGGGGGADIAGRLTLLNTELELAEAKAIAFADGSIFASESVAALESAINDLVEAGVAPDDTVITSLRSDLEGFADATKTAGEDAERSLKDSILDFWGVRYPKTIDEAVAKTASSLKDIGSMARGVFDLIVSNADARAEAEIAALERSLEAFQETGEAQIAFAEAAGEDTTALRAQLEEQAAAKEAEIEKARQALEKKQFERNKKLSIAEATIAGAQAFVRALTAGPIIGPILAGAIAGLTAAQISLIAGQKFPGFQRGGDFTTAGPTAFVAGEGGRRERVRIDPQPGNGRGMDGTVVNITGNEIVGPEGADEFLVRLSEAMERLRSEGTIASL